MAHTTVYRMFSRHLLIENLVQFNITMVIAIEKKCKVMMLNFLFVYWQI